MEESPVPKVVLIGGAILLLLFVFVLGKACSGPTRVTYAEVNISNAGAQPGQYTASPPTERVIVATPESSKDTPSTLTVVLVTACAVVAVMVYLRRKGILVIVRGKELDHK